MNKLLKLIFSCVVFTWSSAWAVDTYNSANGQLTIPAVQVGSSIYNNVVIKVGEIISVGGIEATTSFNPYLAFQKFSKLGRPKSTLSVIKTTNSETCNGTGIFEISPVSSSVAFEGQTAYYSTISTSENFTTCTSRTNITTQYFSKDFMPLGRVDSSNYSVYIGTATLPKSAIVGDSGTFGTFNRYTDSSKKFYLGSTVISYSIEPDTQSSVILKFIYTEMDANGAITSSEIPKYRLFLNDTMDLISDIYISNYTTIEFK